MKKFFRYLHLYLSLAASLIIFCSCLTGTILVFEEEIQHVQHHDFYFTDPKGERLEIETLKVNVLKSVPHGKIASVKVYTDAGRTVEFGLITPEDKHSDKPDQGNRQREHHQKPQNADLKHGDHQPQKTKKPKEGDRPNLTVFVNPYSGAVTGKFNRRHSLFFQAEMLHRFLLAGKNSIGDKIVGFSTLFFLLILITGIILWWPKTAKVMQQRLRYKFDGSRKRIIHDLHVVTGFYTSLFLIVIVLTGLIMAFPVANKILFALAGSKPAAEQPDPPKSTIQTSLISLNADQILALSALHFKNSSYALIRFPKDTSAAFAVNVLPLHGFENTTDTFFIDQYSGKILKTELFSAKSRGQQISAFVKQVHMGAVYGLPTKILSFIVCLLALIFPVTGIMMWLNRTGKQKKKPLKTISVST